MKKKIIFIVVVALAIILVDQGTKYLVKSNISDRHSVQVISDYFQLEYSENPGVAFGMFGSYSFMRWVVIFLGLLFPFAIWLLFKKEIISDRLAIVAFALVTGGDFGNMIDRIHTGRVIDFLRVQISDRYVWPNFNVADMALVIGVSLFVVSSIRWSIKERKARLGQS